MWILKSAAGLVRWLSDSKLFNKGEVLSFNPGGKRGTALANGPLAFTHVWPHPFMNEKTHKQEQMNN